MIVSDELYNVLMRFHREVVLPDIERTVDSRLTPFREEMLANFDALLKRLERPESEYAALRAAVQRVEARMTSIDEKLDKIT